MLPVRPPQTQSLTTRDGIRLDADVYYPDAEGSYPVLLMRQPYGRAIASTVVYAHPSWYAAHGYIVVIQDVRGRGTSEGSFTPFAHEIADGIETVQWAATLPGSEGQVGMYGFSYQGMTQLYAASGRPDPLKVICPAMMAYDLCTDMAYKGGAFCWQSKMGWAIQLEAETARIRGDAAAHQALYAASRQLPLFSQIPTRPEVLTTHAPQSFYFDWLDHPDPNDEYWTKLSPKTYFQDVDLPMLHIGGWFDSYLNGTLTLYHDMAARQRSWQHLIIGPWPHIPWSRKVGSQDYGPAAVNPIDRLQIRWFNHFLKGQDTGILQDPPIHLFELGTNQWRTFDHWPQSGQIYYLDSSGLAAMNDQDGSLTPSPPAPPASDVIVQDPWRPVPALGGAYSIPPGSFERSSIDGRADVLTYTTAPLASDLVLAGDSTVSLFCQSSHPSFDISVVLSEVRPQGVFNLTEGYRRVDATVTTNPLHLPLRPICARIPQGHALRLSVTGSCFPAFPVNPGTGSLAGEATLIEAEIITIQIHSPGSTVSLPVIAD